VSGWAHCRVVSSRVPPIRLDSRSRAALRCIQAQVGQSRFVKLVSGAPQSINWALLTLPLEAKSSSMGGSRASHQWLALLTQPLDRAPYPMAGSTQVDATA
jgi:hypothetical protein